MARRKLILLGACAWIGVFLLVTAPAIVFAGGQGEKAGGPVQLAFGSTWAPSQSGQAEDYHIGIFKAWQAKNPNVKVDLQEYGSADFVQIQEKTWLASNTWPEAFEINTVDLATAAKTGQLLDITAALNADAAWRDSFLPGMVANENLIGGKYYGVPMQFITNETFFYNTDILKQAGYNEFPKTWGDLLALCAKLKSMGYVPIAMVDKATWPAVSHLVEPLCQFIMGPEWVKKVGAFSADVSYADPRFLDVLKKTNDLKTLGYLPSNVASADFGDDTGLYFARKAAIYLDGSWAASGVIQNAPADILAVTKAAPMPRPENSDPGSVYGLFTGGSGWSYAGRADLAKAPDAKRNAVLSLIKYLTGPDAIGPIVQNYQLPPNKLPQGLDMSKAPALMVDTLKMFSASPAIPPMNQEQNGATMSTALYKDCQAMLAGAMTPEQMQQDVQAAYVKAVAEVASMNK